MPRNSPGFFITVDGSTGAGKSTLVSKLMKWTEKRNFGAICHSEPGGLSIDEKAGWDAGLIELPRPDRWCGMTRAMMRSWERFAHIRAVTAPHLESGGLAIYDGFTLTTKAYESPLIVNSVDHHRLRDLLNISTAGIYPDLTIILLIAAETGIRRSQRDKCRWASTDINYHRDVRREFMTHTSLCDREEEEIRRDRNVIFLEVDDLTKNDVLKWAKNAIKSHPKFKYFDRINAPSHFADSDQIPWSKGA